MMKKKYSILNLIFLFGCIFFYSGQLLNANSGKEERNIPDFRELAISVSGNIYVRQGNISYLRIEADEDIIKDILTEVKDGKLNISFKNKMFLKRIKKLNIFVTFKTLESLSLTGSGDMFFIGDMNLSDFEIKSNGSGDIKANNNIKLNNVSISSLGSGDLSFNQFEVKNIKLKNTGSGDINFKHLETNNITIGINGSGDIIASGKAISADFKINGSGDIKMSGFEVDNLKAVINGSGDIYINVLQNVISEKNGSGKIRINN